MENNQENKLEKRIFVMAKIAKALNITMDELIK